MKHRERRTRDFGQSRWASTGHGPPLAPYAARDLAGLEPWARRLIQRAQASYFSLDPPPRDRVPFQPRLFGPSGEPLERYVRGRAATSVTSVNENGGATEEGWEDPIPLGPPSPPELPLDGLPPWLRDHIESVAAHTQAPRDIALLVGLAAISRAVANKGLVIVKGGYSEALQIWTASVAPPGTRKSSVYRHMTEPLTSFEVEERRKYDERREETKNERDIVEAALKGAKKDAKDALIEGNGYEEAMEEVERFSERLADLAVRPPDSIMVSEATAPALGELMEERGGRAAVLSPEGEIFDLMAGLYSDGSPNLHVFKKGWTGNEPISDARITRDGLNVERPALVIGVTIQPSVLANLKGKEQFVGEGLLGRFLYAQPEHRIGSRLTGDAVPDLDSKAQARYANKLRVLLEVEPADVNGGVWEPYRMVLSEEAVRLRNDFEAEIEQSLGAGEDMDGMVHWGSKLVGNMVRVAGLIHLAWVVEENRMLWGDPVSGKAMETAITLGRGLIPHARRVLDEMDLDPKVRLARYVLRRIVTYEGEEPLSRRILHRRCQGKKKIQVVDDLEPPLSLLEDHNYIRRNDRPSTGGRRPSPIIEVNPKALDDIDTSDRSPGQAEGATNTAPKDVPVAAGTESD